MQSTVYFHKKNHFIYILFLLIFFMINTYAETLPSIKSITGKVIAIENETATLLPFASVQLLLKNDSSFVKGTTTNEDGIFQLSLTKEGEYMILISSVGYLKTYEDVKVHAKKTNYDLGEIVLPENAIVLAEASVVAQRREMIVKEDTVEYDATAYRLRENAVVEDLLKRLPGITIDEEGRIFVNGKEVDRKSVV